MKKTLVLLTIAWIFSLLTASFAAERGNPKNIREYRLGEIVIKGEREKPQVYFIIPKAKLKLKKLSPPSDYLWEIKVIKIKR